MHCLFEWCRSYAVVWVAIFKLLFRVACVVSQLVSPQMLFPSLMLLTLLNTVDSVDSDIHLNTLTNIKGKPSLSKKRIWSNKRVSRISYKPILQNHPFSTLSFYGHCLAMIYAGNDLRWFSFVVKFLQTNKIFINVGGGRGEGKGEVTILRNKQMWKLMLKTHFIPFWGWKMHFPCPFHDYQSNSHHKIARRQIQNGPEPMFQPLQSAWP